MPYKAIMLEVDISYRDLYALFLSEGLVTPRPVPPPVSLKDLWDLRQANLPYTEIAQRLGIRTGHAKRLMRRARNLFGAHGGRVTHPLRLP